MGAVVNINMCLSVTENQQRERLDPLMPILTDLQDSAVENLETRSFDLVT